METTMPLQESSSNDNYNFEIFCFTTSLALFYYFYKVSEIPRLIGGNTKMVDLLRSGCPSIVSVFRHTPWCAHPVLQTALRAQFQRRLCLTYNREIVEFSDGGVVALDWYPPSSSNDNQSSSSESAIVVILTGITGSSRENYIENLVISISKAGLRSVVFNYRGMGGVPLKTSKTYSASYSEDIEEVLRIIKQRYPDCLLLGVGFSLGGMVAYNYAAAAGSSCLFDSIVVISSAWDVFASCESLEQKVNRLLFNEYLCRNLVGMIVRNEALFSHLVDMTRLKQARTIREFDEAFVVPVFGFDNLYAYYCSASLYLNMAGIRRPVLVVAAEDDPFAPGESLPIAQFANSEFHSAVLLKRGGHMGFLQGIFPFGENFTERLVTEYAQVLINNKFEFQDAVKTC